MKKKSLLILAAAICLSLPQTLYAEGNFSQEYSTAIAAAETGDYRKSYELFEALLAAHPDEVLVYDTYATIAESKGNYERALAVCEKWISVHGAADPSPIPIAERMRFLKDRISNAKLMDTAPSWEKAKTSGSQLITFVTNVPSPYSDEMKDSIVDIMEKDKAVLEKIFGYPLPEEKPLTIYLTARAEEYVHLFKEKTGQIDFSSAAYYLGGSREIIISSVAMNKAVLAHELAHHIIGSYISSPSIFLNEGLASYVEMKVGKEDSKVNLYNYLETLNYLYDQGQWENFMDLMRDWYAFEQYQANALERGGGLLRHNYYTMFYLRAWSVAHFFAETQDETFRQIFRDYLEFEKNQPSNNLLTFQNYFESRLTEEERSALSDAWSRLTVNLTYEKV